MCNSRPGEARCTRIIQKIKDPQARRAATEHGVRIFLIVAMAALPLCLPEKVAQFIVASLAVYSDKIMAIVMTF
jgi:hypothetical protein